MISVKMPFWLRVVSLLGVVLLSTGAGPYGYRWYNRPVTLTLAVGSFDGEGARAMSAIAAQLAEDGAPVRLKVIDTGTTVEAGKQFTAGNVDLATRGDVGDLSQAQECNRAGTTVYSELLTSCVTNWGTSRITL